MKEASIIVDRCSELCIPVIQLERYFSLRIEIHAAFERERLNSHDNQRRIILVVHRNGNLPRSSGHADCHFLCGDKCARTVYAHAAELAARFLCAVRAFNADQAAEVHLAWSNLKQN